MKTSNWINFIGISCIVLGTSGIALGITRLVLLQMVEMPNANFPEIPPYLLSWSVILAYIGVLVNAISFAAGIFFLMKKQFSLKIMYFALIISILYKFIPMLFLNQYSSLLYFHRYEYNFFTLIGPFFNTVLLIMVYRKGRYYNKPPEEFTEPYKENIKQINFLIYGYILLILSSAFLDVDMIALLAMPAFLLSIVTILIFYLGLISKETLNRRLAISLIISGTILLSAVVGYSAVEYVGYLKDISRSMPVEFLPSLWPIIGVNLLASLTILLGIKQSSILNNRRLFFVWLPTLVILPLVMMVILLLKLNRIGI